MDDQPNTIAMVSEEFLGSAMVGMVHFIKQSSTTTDQSNTSSSDRSTSFWEESETVTYKKKSWGRWSTTSVDTTYQSGSTAHVEQAAKKMMESVSQTGIDVIFNIVVQGYIPSMKQSIVKDSIKEFAAFSPQTVAVTEDQGAVSAADNAITRAENLRYTQMIGQSLSGSGSMVRATIEGLTEATQNSYRVLDFNTFMTAFDEYVKRAPRDEKAGIPVGMNVKQWTKAGVLMAYREYFRVRMDAQMKKMREDRRKREDEGRRRAQAFREDIQVSNQAPPASATTSTSSTGSTTSTTTTPAV